jgi:hypothetical protein
MNSQFSCTRRRIGGVLLSCTLFTACDDAQSRKEQEIRESLVGTWLRDVEVEGGKGRRFLVLGDDGKFSELLVIEFADGRRTRSERSGEWFFDGTNLKRRYTHEDGKMLGSNFSFVTFEITVLTPRDFEGRNHVQGEQISYRRVDPGSRP